MPRSATTEAPAPPAKRKHPEDDLQAELIRLIQMKGWGNFIFAIPNGGKRDAREAARLKAQGVKAGVSDLFVSAMRGGYGGFYIELKAPFENGEEPKKLKGTDDQRAWLIQMEAGGYATMIGNDLEAVFQAIDWYMRGDGLPPSVQRY